MEELSVIKNSEIKKGQKTKTDHRQLRTCIFLTLKNKLKRLKKIN